MVLTAHEIKLKSIGDLGVLFIARFFVCLFFLRTTLLLLGKGEIKQGLDSVPL